MSCIFNFLKCNKYLVRKNEKNKNNIDLSNVTWKDTIPFVPPVTSGLCIKVYDGDTITIASRIPIKDSPLYRFSVRLDGIDTPEIKGKDEDEKECAKMARDDLSKLILNKEVRLEDVKLEKYGRILAQVYLKEQNLNTWMIEQRYAVEYDGGTKKSPESWLDYHNKI